MNKEKLYPGLYVAENVDTRTLLPDLSAGGYYVILVRNSVPENEIFFGRRDYDYSYGMLTGFAPEVCQGALYLKRSFFCRWLLAFRPELLDGPVSDQAIADYTFFSYRPEEALHLSSTEIKILTGYIDDIRSEFQRPVDLYSGIILAKHIGRLLDYIVRFYERQMITRDLVVEKTINAYDKTIEQYIADGCIRTHGLPSAIYCADKLSLSEAHFLDLLKYRTGYTHDGYVQIKRIEIAKRRLSGSNLPIRQIVADLGFPSVQYFSYLFQKLTGTSPTSYRCLN